MDCLFCKIILTIPKKHITSIMELQESDKDTLWHIHHALQQVAHQTGVHKRMAQMNHCKQQKTVSHNRHN
jgi:hypothetical protein